MIIYGQILSLPVSFEYLQNLWSFESCISGKGSRNHPFTEVANEFTRIKSAIRASVEYASGFVTMCIGGKLIRKFGLERNIEWLRLMNQTFNFLRHLYRADRAPAHILIPQRPLNFFVSSLFVIY